MATAAAGSAVRWVAPAPLTALDSPDGAGDIYLVTLVGTRPSIPPTHPASRMGILAMNSVWNELLTTDVGLMSLGVIVGVLVISVVISAVIRKKIAESQPR